MRHSLALLMPSGLCHGRYFVVFALFYYNPMLGPHTVTVAHYTITVGTLLLQVFSSSTFIKVTGLCLHRISLPLTPSCSLQPPSARFFWRQFNFLFLARAGYQASVRRAEPFVAAVHTHTHTHTGREGKGERNTAERERGREMEMLAVAARETERQKERKRGRARAREEEEEREQRALVDSLRFTTTGPFHTITGLFSIVRGLFSRTIGRFCT